MKLSRREGLIAVLLAPVMRAVEPEEPPPPVGSGITWPEDYDLDLRIEEDTERPFLVVDAGEEKP